MSERNTTVAEIPVWLDVNGERVATWTANDAARVNALLDWGVDTLITDAVDALDPDALSAGRG